VLRVDATDQSEWWVSSDDDPRIDLVWPEGSTSQGGTVYSRAGDAVAFVGDSVAFVCVLTDGRAFLPLPSP
jgi:hypothetical protein